MLERRAALWPPEPLGPPPATGPTPVWAPPRPRPSGTLGHTLYRLPCPHKQSLSGQLILLCVHKRTPSRPSPHPQLQPPSPGVAETITASESSSWGTGQVTPSLWTPSPLPSPALPPTPATPGGRGCCFRVPSLLQAGPLHVFPKRLDLGPGPLPRQRRRRQLGSQLQPPQPPPPPRTPNSQPSRRAFSANQIP